MSDTARPSVVIYGNCQAEFLGLLLNQTPSLAARFDFVVPSNALDAGTLPATLREPAARAVLYWEQYDQRAAVERRDAVRSALPSGCTTIRYPAVGLDAFWPFIIKDKRNSPEPGFPFGRFPLGDRIALEVSELGVTGEPAYERYMELSQERMPDLDALVSRDKAVLARREAACDVAMSDVVFDRLRSTYQFWTRGHLAIAVLSELLRRLLQISSGVLGAVDATAAAELDAAFRRYPGQGTFQHPIHPLVIQRLGLQFVDEETRYEWFGRSWTFREHMTRYISFDRNW